MNVKSGIESMSKVRLKINRQVRFVLIIALILVILAAGYSIYDSTSNLGVEDRRITIFTYSGSGEIAYTVYLKPNKLYTKNTMGEGKLYITEFVDYIDADFEYNFTSQDAVDIKGNYNIVAKVQGFVEEKNEEINIWERNFPIVENKQFSLSEDELSINESLKISLDRYNTFATEVIEASKIKGSRARLMLVMNVNLSGVSEKGEFKSNISPNLVIPLGTSMFQITGNSAIEVPGRIENIIQVKQAVNKKHIMLYSTMLVIFILAIIALLFFTEEVHNDDPFERELKKIFKRYGDRLVALNTKLDNESAKEIRSIEDLIRVADEMDKPIFYEYSEEYSEIDSFYVIDGDEIYILNISKSLLQDS